MIVLALDTAHEFGSLAVSYGTEVVEEILLHEPGGFSGTLFHEIEALLKRNNFRSEEVDIYAAGSGPGSFTGVRIALAAAKALAEVNRKPCFGVSNLEAMASYGSAETRAAVLDARRGEVYGGVFGALSPDERVAPLPAWLAGIPDSVGEFLAFDFVAFEPGFAGCRFTRATRTRVARGLAGVMAGIALDRFRIGEPSDPADVEANYVRRSDAELLWKDAG